MRPLLLLLLAACNSPEPEDTADRGSADTGLGDSGTEDTGAADSAGDSGTLDTGAADTGDAQDTGDTGNSDAACGLVANTAWRSVDELECGLTPDGVALCNWRVQFTEGDWIWHHSDVGELGTWTCEAGAITGQRGAGSAVLGTLHDAAHLTWDGVPYVPDTGADTGADTGSDTGSAPALCDSLPGSGWASEELLECGRGGAACRWTLDFTASDWTFVHSDVAETGRWSCAEGELTGAMSWGNPVRASLIDDLHLTWDGVSYLRTR